MLLMIILSDVLFAKMLVHLPIDSQVHHLVEPGCCGMQCPPAHDEMTLKAVCQTWDVAAVVFEMIIAGSKGSGEEVLHASP